jgi:glutathione synthase/RimK-type ligase-like ATP-grasp enzyme
MTAPSRPRPLGVYYEHPDWFRPLFIELERRGIPHRPIHAEGHAFDPADRDPELAMVFNRMSPSAWQRGRAPAVLYTGHYLRHLEEAGVRVLNGVEAWRTEISKARQLAILEQLELACPRSRILSDPAGVVEAAAGLRFPVVVKPNIGGSGAGVRRFDSVEELEAAVDELDFGIDHTGIVQEYIPPRDGHIVRVEVVGGRYLYAIAVYPPEGTFNLCPADACVTGDGRQLERTFCAVDAADNGLRVEAFEPPVAVQAQVEGIMAAAGIEVGGVEYVVDDRDGTRYFYDVNALSNFVADAENVIGFDPFQRLVDWIEEELEAVWGAERDTEREVAERARKEAAGPGGDGLDALVIEPTVNGTRAAARGGF